MKFYISLTITLLICCLNASSATAETVVIFSYEEIVSPIIPGANFICTRTDIDENNNSTTGSPFYRDKDISIRVTIPDGL